MDGSGAGCGRGRSRAVGDDGAAPLILDGYGLYRQRATEEAGSLSTGRPSQAYPGLRLMPIGADKSAPTDVKIISLKVIIGLYGWSDDCVNAY
jgi:hypothetical protein